MRKLILRCGLAPGDIVMLTAAVRDLHRCYPGRFITDVRTFSPELWEHNPYITPLQEEDPEVEVIDCSYPLINRANEIALHCLHGFITFLNRHLRLSIRLTAVAGDLHLSDQEKAWYSQVHEVTREDTPFWIVAAGGKYDVTIKWWERSRFQQVIDRLRGKIQFVQVGRRGHFHPRLDGVIDLRGETNLRELIRLVYHAQGVLCPITLLMHLAAAVETRPGRPATRPCVVVAGGREPAHWESYPGHEFIHVNGALDCCRDGGCWRDRTMPLRDGDERDRKSNLCVDVVNRLPRCMNMISPAGVVSRLESYFERDLLRPLSRPQRRAAARGVKATLGNDFDQQTLTIHNAGLACDDFTRSIPSYPGSFQGRGIVICGGGVRYFTNAWVCIRTLRRLGCRLPIQLWHLGRNELDARMRSLVRPLGVDCIDALRVRRKHPVRALHGWALKPYALLHCPFREVLLLDADNVPVADPEFLFDTPQFKATGAVFWPDFSPEQDERAKPVWRSCGLRPPREHEFESGQILVDKRLCWRALCLCMWFNENSDFYYGYLHGDKETFHLAFRKLRQPYSLVPIPIHYLPATMCQHDFAGRRLFQHRNLDKWDFLLCNRRIDDFWFEQECRDYLAELRMLWDGGLSRVRNVAPVERVSGGRQPRLAAVMISCAERNHLRQQTLHNLAKTDWGDLPIHVQMDPNNGEDQQECRTRCALLALQSAADSGAEYILLLEDDLNFNRHIRHNLHHWRPIRDRTATLASLYNPGLREVACDQGSHSRIVAPSSVFGSQAFLLSRDALAHVTAHWNRVTGPTHVRISRLAGRLGRPIRYHAPSLVQHVGKVSVSDGQCHQAADFDPDWKARP